MILCSQDVNGLSLYKHKICMCKYIVCLNVIYCLSIKKQLKKMITRLTEIQDCFKIIYVMLKLSYVFIHCCDKFTDFTSKLATLYIN